MSIWLVIYLCGLCITLPTAIFAEGSHYDSTGDFSLSYVILATIAWPISWAAFIYFFIEEHQKHKD